MSCNRVRWGKFFLLFYGEWKKGIGEFGVWLFFFWVGGGGVKGLIGLVVLCGIESVFGWCGWVGEGMCGLGR